MIVHMALALLLSFSSGLCVVSLLWPRSLATRTALVLQLSLAFGFGFGLSSLWFFLWLCFAGARNAFFLTFVLPECAIAAGLGYLCFRRTTRPSMLHDHALPDPPPDWLSRFLGAIFCAILLSAIASFVFISLRNPHGQFDATSIWNLRARFLARGTTHWRDAFADSLSIPHPDYPLLLPGSIARLWKYAGRESVLLPMAAAFLFTFSTVGLLCSSLSFLRNKRIGYLGGMVLLGVNSFIPLGASQYADTAVGMFMLSTLILLAVYDASPEAENAGLLVLAGGAAGFCAWTKNEGQLFLLVVLAVRLALTLLHRGWRASAREAAAIVAGFLPVLAVLALFRLSVTPANYYLLAGTDTSGPMKYFLEPGTIGQKVMEIARYRLIAKMMLQEIASFGARAIGVTPFLALYLLLVGVYKKNLASVQTGVAVLLLMLSGYFAVYLTTPLILLFQLQTSLSRLLLQLWPSAVFIFFMATASGEVRESAPLTVRTFATAKAS